MSVIFKYTIGLGPSTVTVPVSSRPLCVDIQDGHARVWIIVPGVGLPATDQIYFYMAMTGEEFSDNIGIYLGSVVGIYGSLVGHVFYQ